MFALSFLVFLKELNGKLKVGGVLNIGVDRFYVCVRVLYKFKENENFVFFVMRNVYIVYWYDFFLRKIDLFLNKLLFSRNYKRI